MNGINSIRFGAIPQGATSGTLGFLIDLDGAPLTDPVDALMKIRAYSTRYKNAAFENYYPSDDVNLYTMLQSLHDSGFKIEALINGNIAYSWLKFVDYIIVERDASPWPGFYCHEFRFHLKDAADNEPFIPEHDPKLHPFPTNRFLAPAKDLDIKKVLRWMETASAAWRILHTPKRLFEPDTIWRKRE